MSKAIGVLLVGMIHRTALGVNDKERGEAAIKRIEGKRLTDRRTDEATHA